MVNTRTAEGNIGGERGGVVVRAERRLTLRPVLYHEIQCSKTLAVEGRWGGDEGRGGGDEGRGGGDEGKSGTKERG